VLETPQPNQHWHDQKQESKEQCTSYAEKCRASLVFLESQSAFLRIEHSLELEFKRPVTFFRRPLPNAVEDTGHKICVGLRMGDEKNDAGRSDFLTHGVNWLFF